MIFTRFRSSPSSSSSWFYALVSTLHPYATTSITVSKTWLYSIFFLSLSLPPFQGTSYFFPLYLHLSSASLSLFFLFHLSQSFVLSTPTDIEFSSRRINFSFLLSAIPYWLMYPSVSSCSRFLFIVPRTPSIFQRLAVGRFYFSLPPPPHPSIALFHSTRAESTGHGPDNEYSNFETRLGRWRARRAIQKFKSDGLSDTRCRGTRCIIDYAYDPPRYISSGHSLISNRTIYIYI